MLAGVIAAPSDYSPFVNLALASDRQRHVLDRMVESGYITQAASRCSRERAAGSGQSSAHRACKAISIRTSPRTSSRSSKSSSGSKRWKRAACKSTPRSIRSMQEEAQEAIDWGRRSARSRGASTRDEAALVAIRPSTGEIVAMVGGKGFSLDNQFNRAWQARRQPGSSFKLYVYTAAIDSGMPPTRSSTTRR